MQQQLFFCIGKNVAAYPQIYKRLIDEGHAVANHTHHHLNGWKNSNEIYLDDIVLAQKYIDSKLFRPPYGRIRFSQLKRLISHAFGFKTIMWSVLSGDFDKGITKEKCLQNVICNTTGGSIIVFHDSDKAFERMQYALPATLKYFTEKGFKFKKINIDVL